MNLSDGAELEELCIKLVLVLVDFTYWFCQKQICAWLVFYQPLRLSWKFKVDTTELKILILEFLSFLK